MLLNLGLTEHTAFKIVASIQISKKMKISSGIFSCGLWKGFHARNSPLLQTSHLQTN